MAKRIIMFFMFVSMVFSSQGYSLERPDYEFKIFQFPRTMMPRIDGKTDGLGNCRGGIYLSDRLAQLILKMVTVRILIRTISM